MSTLLRYPISLSPFCDLLQALATEVFCLPAVLHVRLKEFRATCLGSQEGNFTLLSRPSNEAKCADVGRGNVQDLSQVRPLCLAGRLSLSCSSNSRLGLQCLQLRQLLSGFQCSPHHLHQPFPSHFVVPSFQSHALPSQRLIRYTSCQNSLVMVDMLPDLEHVPVSLFKGMQSSELSPPPPPQLSALPPPLGVHTLLEKSHGHSALCDCKSWQEDTAAHLTGFHFQICSLVLASGRPVPLHVKMCHGHSL